MPVPDKGPGPHLCCVPLKATPVHLELPGGAVWVHPLSPLNAVKPLGRWWLCLACCVWKDGSGMLSSAAR